MSDDLSHCILLVDIRDVIYPPHAGRHLALQIQFETRPPFIFCPDTEDESGTWFATLKGLCSPSQRSTGDTLPGVFHVYLLPTPNLTAHGECVLQVTTYELVLSEGSDVNTGRLLTRWPLCSLRRYGRDNAKFTIETGRSAPTGEGIFVFNSYQSEQIYQSVHRASNTIMEAHRLGRTIQNGVPPSPTFNTLMTDTESNSRRPVPYVNVATHGSTSGSHSPRHPQYPSSPDRRPLPPVPALTRM
jgi:hypothetical protein